MYILSVLGYSCGKSLKKPRLLSKKGRWGMVTLCLTSCVTTEGTLLSLLEPWHAHLKSYPAPRRRSLGRPVMWSPPLPKGAACRDWASPSGPPLPEDSTASLTSLSSCQSAPPVPRASLKQPGFLEFPGHHRLPWARDLQLEMLKSYSRLPGKPQSAEAGQGHAAGRAPWALPHGHPLGFSFQTVLFPFQGAEGG